MGERKHRPFRNHPGPFFAPWGMRERLAKRVAPESHRNLLHSLVGREAIRFGIKPVGVLRGTVRA
jgi:hypothetical protein